MRRQMRYNDESISSCQCHSFSAQLLLQPLRLTSIEWATATDHLAEPPWWSWWWWQWCDALITLHWSAPLWVSFALITDWANGNSITTRSLLCLPLSLLTLHSFLQWQHFFYFILQQFSLGRHAITLACEQIEWTTEIGSILRPPTF